MAAKKKTAKVYGSKTQFVMGLPHEVSAKDVVARAKAKGLALTEAHVYKIRSTNKSKGAGAKAGKAPAKKAAKKAAPAKSAKKAAKKSVKKAPAKKAAKKAAKKKR